MSRFWIYLLAGVLITVVAQMLYAQNLASDILLALLLAGLSGLQFFNPSKTNYYNLSMSISDEQLKRLPVLLIDFTWVSLISSLLSSKYLQDTFLQLIGFVLLGLALISFVYNALRYLKLENGAESAGSNVEAYRYVIAQAFLVSKLCYVFLILINLLVKLLS